MNLSERDARIVTVASLAGMAGALALHVLNVVTLPPILLAAFVLGLVLTPIDLAAIALSPRYKAWRYSWKETTRARRATGEPALTDKQRAAVSLAAAIASIGLASFFAASRVAEDGDSTSVAIALATVFLAAVATLLAYRLRPWR